MKIIRAEHLGLCFGVRDAIALAQRTAETQPLTILGDLVHNETVLRELRDRGIQFEKDLANAGNGTVMITAHGASDKTLQKVRQSGHPLLEATCPLVHYAHRSLRKLVEGGYFPVIIGQRGHVEVRGMTEDLEKYEVVLSADDVANLKEHSHFGVVAQTTQPIEKVRHLVDLIRHGFPNSQVRFHDTVCQPTKQRQTAAVALAQKCEVVLVIGGAHSNNTRELVATCSRFCPRVHHVQTVSDVRPEWLEGAETVGLTAGTSTPDAVINEVEKQLERLTPKTASYFAEPHT